MLLALMGTEELSNRLDHLIVFDGPELFSFQDLSWVLGSIDRLYKLLLTLLHKEYFADKWLRSANPNFAEEDLLLVESISKNSPAEFQVSAVGEAAKALGDVLSIGKQLTDFKTSGVKVEEAKLDLERKKRELAEEDRKRSQQAALSDLDLEIEREKKLLELEQLRSKRDEEQRKRQRQVLEDVDQRLDLLSKGIKVLSEVPEEVKLDLRAALFAELEIMSRTPLSVKSLEIVVSGGQQT
jgi:Asp-tRNA(Asn)/Glu-tRNA(Gln) amidotransferase C subunit